MQGHPSTELAGGRNSVLATSPFGAPAITVAVTALRQGRPSSAKALDGAGSRSPGHASTCLSGGCAIRKAWRPGEVHGGPVHGPSTQALQHHTGLAAVSSSAWRRPEGARSASRHYVNTCPHSLIPPPCAPAAPVLCRRPRPGLLRCLGEQCPEVKPGFREPTGERARATCTRTHTQRARTDKQPARARACTHADTTCARARAHAPCTHAHAFLMRCLGAGTHWHCPTFLSQAPP